MTERFVDLMDRTFSATERGVIYRRIRSRRDIRQSVPDPIPPETLLRICWRRWDGGPGEG